MAVRVDATAHRAHPLCSSSGCEEREMNQFSLITQRRTPILIGPGCGSLSARHGDACRHALLWDSSSHWYSTGLVKNPL